MGREIKRVALDFEWPLGKVWEGFLLPEKLCETECSECDGSGQTSARLWVDRIVHTLLMLDDDRKYQQQVRPLHPWLDEIPMRPDKRPSADIEALGTGLSGRASSFLGHDAIDRFHATKKIAEAAGLDPEVWGICQTCQGHGAVENYPGQREEAEAWEKQEPPAGEGWQLWETVSDGSPITPVFPTAQALARHMQSERPWRYSGTYEQALQFIEAGWAPSLAADESGVYGGAEFVGRDA